MTFKELLKHIDGLRHEINGINHTDTEAITDFQIDTLDVLATLAMHVGNLEQRIANLEASVGKPTEQRPMNDGGSAFPEPMTLTANGDLVFPSHYGNGGMRLRDYFATKAMQAIIGLAGEFDSLEFHHAASCAYEMADTMLAVRNDPSKLAS